MNHARVRTLAAAVTVVAALGAAAPASASTAGALLDRDAAVTVAQVAQASTRSGWHPVAFHDADPFGCGAFAVLGRHATNVTRVGFASAQDSSAAEVVALFATAARARAAARRTAAQLRGCVDAVPYASLRTDEQVRAPGRARLIQLRVAPACCDISTHSFGVVQRGRRTALVWLGELGTTRRGPVRGLVAAASARVTH